MGWWKTFVGWASGLVGWASSLVGRAFGAVGGATASPLICGLTNSLSVKHYYQQSQDYNQQLAAAGGQTKVHKHLDRLDKKNLYVGLQHSASNIVEYEQNV